MLHHQIRGQGQPIVLLHGLFGSLSNLGLISRKLASCYQVINIDLPNHGQSVHTQNIGYQQMAVAVHHTLQELNIERYSLVGHSMGGKVAMKMADIAPQSIEKLIVLDMAPMTYTDTKYLHIFQALNAVAQASCLTSRVDALKILEKYIGDESMRQFLSKSLVKNESGFQWQFNHRIIEQDYRHILHWENITPCKVETLFMIGANSDYVPASAQKIIMQQFPHSKAHIVANCGHWLHAEKPVEVARGIQRFLERTTIHPL